MTGQVPGNILAQLAEFIKEEYNRQINETLPISDDLLKHCIALFLVENHLKIVER